MCGISFALGEGADDVFASLVSAVVPRGPDSHKTVVINKHEHVLRFHASVLHLRGNILSEQPFTSNGDVFLYVRKACRLNVFANKHILRTARSLMASTSCHTKTTDKSFLNT